MKIVVACDSYKGCLSSLEVAKHIQNGIQKACADAEVFQYAIGDGGEGSVEAFFHACQGEMVEGASVDAYFKRIKVQYCMCQQTAFIEAASVIGLTMTPKEKRAPMIASSYGIGLILLDAMAKGAKKIILGLGGTCTNDGGLGMLQALGVKFFDKNHNILNAQAISIEKVEEVDFSMMKSFAGIELIAACDVSNYLLGEKGATYVFGKQKGLYPNQQKRMEAGMQNYRDCILKTTGIDLNSFAGGGAAGGIGAVAIGLLNARMQPGIDLILSYSDFEEKLQECDLVITGEGQTDRQTIFGKVPMGILNKAKKYDKPVIILSGALGLEYQKLYDEGFIGIYSIADRAMSFQQALEQADVKLENASYSLMRTIAHFKKA